MESKPPVVGLVRQAEPVVGLVHQAESVVGHFSRDFQNHLGTTSLDAV